MNRVLLTQIQHEEITKIVQYKEKIFFLSNYRTLDRLKICLDLIEYIEVFKNSLNLELIV